MRDENIVWNELFAYDDIVKFIDYMIIYAFTKYGSMLFLTVHYIIDIIFCPFRVFYIYIYIYIYNFLLYICH